MKYVCSKYAKLLFAARELLLIQQQIFYTLPSLNTSQRNENVIYWVRN